jgi:diamine N-acetyltransferase
MIAYTAAEPAIREPLRAMARRSFAETFSRHYAPEPFSAFLDGAYGPGGTMSRDLEDPAVRWRVAVHGAEPIGYAKLTPLRAPAAAPAPGALELQQIYVLSDWHGTGVAARLMEWALQTAARDRAPEVYLTVFDHNERAKAFYRRYGFADVGGCTFTLGQRVDEDRIWRIRLT